MIIVANEEKLIQYRRNQIGYNYLLKKYNVLKDYMVEFRREIKVGERKLLQY